MKERKFLSGNDAVAEAVQRARVESIAAYPITPQTGIVNSLTEKISKKQFDATITPVESEFSAISISIGSELGGIRSFTATSSQGLLHMAEATFLASGLRIPLVMAVVNRAISAPVSIFGDHQDAMILRDNNWLQFYCKDVEEIFDTIILAYKIAENKKVLLPVIVNIDGFFLSHLHEPVEIPSIQEIDSFLPRFKPEFPHMNVEDPKFIGVAAWPDYYEEMVYVRHIALQDSIKIISEEISNYSNTIRKTDNVINEYKCKDADLIIIGLGSAMSTLELSIDKLKDSSINVGLIRIKVFRPFPSEHLKKQLNDAKTVIVIDQAISPGQSGPLFLEVKTLDIQSKVYGVILGLGGRDINPRTGIELVKYFVKNQNELSTEKSLWFDLRNDIIKRWLH